MKPLSATDPREAGPYRLLGRLGGGGMGQVFLGRSPGGLTVAVKVVRPELAEDAMFRQRFAREVEAARRIGGFYTAHVVDADPQADPPWMVTAYIPGPTLRDAVARHGPMPAPSVAVLGAGLAEGLAAIHARGVVHRDLKPGNVILATDGPRVIDFGIARALDASHAHLTGSVVMGTPPFMSPEQIRGSEVEAASDVFSLAAVLAYAATGHGPFGDGPTEAVIYRVVHGEPDLSGLPTALASLLRACFAKEPKDRPGVAEVLELCAAQGGPQGSWLPPDVTAMVTERVLAASELSTATAPPVVGQAPLAPATPSRALPPVEGRAGRTTRGYTQIRLPWVPGETGGMRKTTVVRWLKQVGDTVEQGERLLEVDSSRGHLAVSSPVTGTLYNLYRQSGEVVRNGAVVAGIGTPTAFVPTPSVRRRRRNILYGVALAFVVFLVGVVIAADSSLFEGDLMAVEGGDCVRGEFSKTDSSNAYGYAGWATVPCGLMTVRTALWGDGAGDGEYVTVLARLPYSLDPFACAKAVPGWAAKKESQTVAVGTSMILCVEPL
ncbi:protein kinase [Streptomyces sp. NPDC001941]|uniref:protein kinase domain-containing protein n=1 Tax=Streptomyces sp. NPDC001941 TaxID=3154659 RepID=UPI00333442CD